METERYLLDAMLGKISTYLRMCGYDAAYVLDRGVEADARLLEIAREERRTVPTRDRALAASAPDSVLLESRTVHKQLRELVDAGLDLTPAKTPTRCSRCKDCGQHFWKGSHWDDVSKTLSEL